ncbi:NUDIX hydrolase [Vibrio sonorensis]|uniref:NUDIX hydrolase n=1 Tax=Vibrio sonorensis TaxID=1004316 RepID=UPI0008D9677F|nr:NUDIX hydrolase [Vibrio sonorensis]
MDKNSKIRTIHRWKRISLIEEHLDLPNGKQIVHTTLQHPGAAVILPITSAGKIVMVNQYRPSLKKWLLELPAGTLEAEEDATQCASRELTEETGYIANQLFPLGQVTPLAGFCDEIQYLYVAKDLIKTDNTNCDDDEVIEVVELEIDELEKQIKEGVLTDAKTIACLCKAKLCGYI